jgi:signal transduction histidine kinase
MFQSIRSKILLLVIGLVLIILITFAFNTKKNYQAEITTQYHNLAVESLNSVMKVIDAEYNDLLTYEIDTISHTRSLMENIGASILPMIDSFYDQQKAGFVTEQLAKEQCLNRIEEYRYQNNNYFFVFDTNLTGLAHPNKEMVGKKWSGFQDLKKKDALNRIQKIIKNKKKSFTVFMWPRLEDMKTVKQLGFFVYYPRWEWIIGTAIQGKQPIISRILLNIYIQIKLKKK